MNTTSTISKKSVPPPSHSTPVHWLWIPAVILLFFAGDRVAGWVMKQLTQKSQFRYSRLYTDRAEADILLVGNSRGLIFYQPYIEEVTGKSTFNVSYNGMPIDLAQALVGDYYDRYPAPETMILDVTMCDRVNTQLVNGFNLYTPYSERIGQLIRDTSQNVYWAGKFSWLFLHNSEIFQRALFYLGKSDEDWLLDRRIPKAMIDRIEESDPLNFELKGKLLEQLKATVQLAQSKGTKVTLVVNPYYIPYAKRFIHFEDWKREIEKATGLKVRDYSQSVSNIDGIGDYQHLNKKGSREYIDLLVRDGVLRR